MIDWLRRRTADPSIALGGRELPVAIRRHKRARRMTLRLAPDGSEVRLTIPHWGRTAEALEFAARRRDWLEAQLAKLPQAAPPVSGGTISYRGAKLAVEWAAKASRTPVLDGASVRLGGPETRLARRLQRWLESEALVLMGADLADYCAAAGREAPLLRLSRAQRRWGSCAGDGTIRVNWRLVQAPDHVRRSVVAHEVAHLAHFDHGPGFHAFLDEIYEGEIAEADRWLKQYGRSLYSAFG
jgi:predicted metal-dependent hydrolase